MAVLKDVAWCNNRLLTDALFFDSQVFEKFDEDHDGMLNRVEFGKMMNRNV